MKDCPTCGGSGKVPDDYKPRQGTDTGWPRPSQPKPYVVSSGDQGGMCSCNGPPHVWDPTWCPPSGPVS